MRVSTVREFRDQATGLMRSKEPILITRRGKMAGIFFPANEDMLSLDLKRELFMLLSADVGRRLNEAGVTEEEVLNDFAEWRKARRATRGGR